MADFLDHYDTLQVSKNADSDTVQRVFRMLAQRYHPDNQDTGSEEHFRQIHEAYLVLIDPEERAKYDIRHATFRQERWKFVADGAPGDNDFGMEQHTRFVVLEILQPPQDRTVPPRPVAARSDRADRPASRAPRVHSLVSGAAQVGCARRSIEPDHHGGRCGFRGAEFAGEAEPPAPRRAPLIQALGACCRRRSFSSAASAARSALSASRSARMLPACNASTRRRQLPSRNRRYSSASATSG